MRKIQFTSILSIVTSQRKHTNHHKHRRPFWILAGNFILILLDQIVCSSPPTFRALLYDRKHVPSGLFLSGLGSEAGAQLLDRLATETRKSSVQHERDKTHNGFCVRPRTETKWRGIELVSRLTVKEVTLKPRHQIHSIVTQLKHTCLENILQSELSHTMYSQTAITLYFKYIDSRQC